MSGLNVILNPQDLKRWVRGVKGVNREVHRQAEDLPRKNSIDYVMLLIRNIQTSKFSGTYASYNPRYLEWKLQYGKRQGFHQLTGDLVNALKSFRIASKRSGVTAAYMGGITQGITDSGGKSWFGKGDKGKSKSISMYARVSEFGGNFGKGGVHPKRPVFEPTAEEYSNNGMNFRVKESFNKIRNRWT